MNARPVGTWFLAVAGVAVVAALAAALAVIGPPAQQRAQRFDERRVRELMGLQGAIDRFAATENRLPADLGELARHAPTRSIEHLDPESGQSYGYLREGTRRYRLCATFATALRMGGGEFAFDADWHHPAGRYCFARTVPANAGGEAAAASVEPAGGGRP